ncbi:hypothetical protein QQ045_029202 [Rhodiola kirilowii]
MPETRSISDSLAILAQTKAEMSQPMNQVLITMTETSSTSDSLAILTQTMADDRAYFTGMLEQLRGELQDLKLSQLEYRAFFIGMLEQLRGEIQELKLSGARASKQLIDETVVALNPLLPTPPPCELSMLPAEIITDIFSRLPAADLVKFRYLNKSYNSLIQSKYFIKLHLLKTVENINETRIWRVLMKGYTRPLWSIKVEALDDYLGLKMSDKSASDAVAPFSRPFQVPVSYSIVGSSNGLLCFYSTTESKFLVCNPCTGAHKYYAGDMVTGDSSRLQPRFVWYQYGFGDDGTGRFKIVRLGRCHGSIKHDYGGQITVEITIFTLGDSCFRQTEQMVPRMVLFENGLYFEGVLHWVDWQDGIIPADVKRGIIVFSLGKEKFEPVMPLPPYDDDETVAIFRLKVICGKLTAFFARTNRNGSSVFEIWVMDIYGVKESWSRKIVLSYPSDDLFENSIEPEVQLISILRNGSVIFNLQDDETAARWVVYDPTEKTFSIIKYDSPPAPQATEYVETLLPPK